MRIFVTFLICLMVVFLAYVRLAPSPAAQWHTSISAEADQDMEGGVIRIIPNIKGTMETLDIEIQNLPRTTVFAGSAAAGLVTYITRSKLIGFPDYTTIEATDETIKIFSRLRFGRSDFGVNAARVRQLILTLD